MLSIVLGDDIVWQIFAGVYVKKVDTKTHFFKTTDQNSGRFDFFADFP
jgi:hypothetical protein